MHDFQTNVSLFLRVQNISSKPRRRSLACPQSSAISHVYSHTHSCSLEATKLSLVVNSNRRSTYSTSTIASFNAKHISSDSISRHTNHAATSTYSEI